LVRGPEFVMLLFWGVLFGKLVDQVRGVGKEVERADKRVEVIFGKRDTHLPGFWKAADA
jgi:hypothetical protein